MIALRDIIVQCHFGEFQRLHEARTTYLPLQHPLLFLYEEDIYQEDILFRSSSRNCAKRVKVSIHEFIAYRIEHRVNKEGMVLKGQRFFQQFVVNCYSMIEFNDYLTLEITKKI